jgi:hypothetical protein
MKKDSKGATAPEMIAFLKECLEPEFGNAMLRFSRPHLGDEDGFILSYNSVPAGTDGVAVLNTWATPKFSIHGAPGARWDWDGHTTKVKLEMFSGSVYSGRQFGKGESIKLRSKTGTPEQVITYLVRFFMENKAILLP